MSYRVPLVASAACIAAVSLTACGGGSDKASSSTSPSTVASTSSTSSAATTPSSTSQPSTSTPSTTATTSKPASTSTPATVTRTVAPSTTTSKPAATKTTAAAPAKKAGCFTSDGKELLLEGVSCGFAQNAYTVYKGGYTPNDTGQYQAKSPNGNTYTFNCMSNDQNVTNCGGGNLRPGSMFSWQN